ncbi:hypothetical protein ACFO0M_27405 [Micromonospora mangrovi]|uniref:Cupin 2 conserved barrel domain-containing protein n=2 Tax=Micromonospora TaxID=1873 RepID=A0AAU7MDP9_9ACTN
MTWVVGGRTHYLGPGDFRYHPARAVHHGQCLPGAECVFHVRDDKAYDIHPADGS